LTSAISIVFVVPAQIWAHVTPPVLVQHYGIWLRSCFVEATVEELLSENGAISGAIAIGTAIKVLENGVLDGAE
jgi:hypothetical protein